MSEPTDEKTRRAIDDVNKATKIVFPDAEPFTESLYRELARGAFGFTLETVATAQLQGWEWFSRQHGRFVRLTPERFPDAD